MAGFFDGLRRPIPSADAEYNDDEWYEDLQKQRHDLAVRVGKAYNISAERREGFKRRYWG